MLPLHKNAVQIIVVAPVDLAVRPGSHKDILIIDNLMEGMKVGL